MSPFDRARKIVATGGQILLPYAVGDAQVTWPSRRELAWQIEQEIERAVEEARHNDDLERGEHD